MNLQPLFTSARVVTAVYRIVSTTMLLAYLASRIAQRKPVKRRHKRAIYHTDFDDSGMDD